MFPPLCRVVSLTEVFSNLLLEGSGFPPSPVEVGGDSEYLMHLHHPLIPALSLEALGLLSVYLIPGRCAAVTDLALACFQMCQVLHHPLKPPRRFRLLPCCILWF